MRGNNGIGGFELLGAKWANESRTVHKVQDKMELPRIPINLLLCSGSCRLLVAWLWAVVTAAFGF